MSESKSDSKSHETKNPTSEIAIPTTIMKPVSPQNMNVTAGKNFSGCTERIPDKPTPPPNEPETKGL